MQHWAENAKALTLIRTIAFLSSSTLHTDINYRYRVEQGI